MDAEVTRDPVLEDATTTHVRARARIIVRGREAIMMGIGMGMTMMVEDMEGGTVDMVVEGGHIRGLGRLRLLCAMWLPLLYPRQGSVEWAGWVEWEASSLLLGPDMDGTEVIVRGVALIGEDTEGCRSQSCWEIVDLGEIYVVS